MHETVKVLFLSANPQKRMALRTDRELGGILRAVRAAPGGLLQIMPEMAVGLDDLQSAILHHGPQIIHFAGHGDGSAGLLLDDGEAVSADALVELMEIFSGSVRAVVLNACHTDLIAEALSRVVDYAVGMGEPIGDKAAIAFAGAFYRALAFGRSIPVAFRLGRSQVAIHRHPRDGVPSLRVRPGNRPGPLVPRASGEDTQTPSHPGTAAPSPRRGQRIRIG